MAMAMASAATIPPWSPRHPTRQHDRRASGQERRGRTHRGKADPMPTSRKAHLVLSHTLQGDRPVHHARGQPVRIAIWIATTLIKTVP